MVATAAAAIAPEKEREPQSDDQQSFRYSTKAMVLIAIARETLDDMSFHFLRTRSLNFRKSLICRKGPQLVIHESILLGGDSEVLWPPKAKRAHGIRFRCD